MVDLVELDDPKQFIDPVDEGHTRRSNKTFAKGGPWATQANNATVRTHAELEADKLREPTLEEGLEFSESLRTPTYDLDSNT